MLVFRRFSTTSRIVILLIYAILSVMFFTLLETRVNAIPTPTLQDAKQEKRKLKLVIQEDGTIIDKNGNPLPDALKILNGQPFDSPINDNNDKTVINGKAIKKFEPRVPEEAKSRGKSGAFEIKVRVIIDEQGKVVATRAVSGDEIFYSTAEKAARKWQFSPTMIDGKPTYVRGTITFTFRIEFT